MATTNFSYRKTTLGVIATASLWLFGPGASYAQFTDAQMGVAPAPQFQSARPALDGVSTVGTPAIVSSANGRQAVQAQQLQQPSLPARQPKSVAGFNVFETYVERATGKRLEVFGKNLFTDVPTTFAPFDTAQVNADYVIGPGDVLQIKGWGMVDIDVNAAVDRGGEIYIPRVGSVKVAGVRYGDLQGHLKKAVGRIFSNFELTASVAQTRVVQIYIVGNAARPGTYVLSSMTTLLNALFTSGGPNSTGTMRNIQLQRGGKTISHFDLYEMLLSGNKTGDVTLKDGDVIFIPEVGPMVALTGSVKTPAIFEMKHRASLNDLIKWAGGMDSAAVGKKVVVEKSIDNRFQTVVELTGNQAQLESALQEHAVQAADVFRVFAPDAVPVEARIVQEYVRVSGEAAKTGTFLIQKGETLRSLIARLGGVTEHGYLYATQLLRESTRVAQQARLDEVAERFERDVEAMATQRIGGTTDKDSVAIISAEIERQRRLAQRLRTVKAEGRIVLEMEDAGAQVKNLPELLLRDGDAIIVPRKPDTVQVLGSVFQQNTFIYKPRRTVTDYVELAGGATDSADMSEMYLIRADGTAKAGGGWFRGLGGVVLNPGDTIVVPQTIDRSTWRQSLKEWTAIFYQFGLGAAGLKVLKD